MSGYRDWYVAKARKIALRRALPFIVAKMKKAMRVLLMAQVDLATQDKTV